MQNNYLKGQLFLIFINKRDNAKRKQVQFIHLKHF